MDHAIVPRLVALVVISSVTSTYAAEGLSFSQEQGAPVAPASALAGHRMGLRTDTHAIAGTLEHTYVGQRGSSVVQARLDGGGWLIAAEKNGWLAGEFFAPASGRFQLRGAPRGRIDVLSLSHLERPWCRRPETPAPPVASGPGVRRGAGGAVTIDVLFMYTPDALSVAGSAAAIDTIVDTFIAYSDMAYENSGVLHRLRAIGAVETDYVESGSILTDIDRLRTPGDGFMDEVPALRDEAGADLVSLFVTSGGAGVGYQLFELTAESENTGFSVVGVNESGLVFAHEIGHNLGCCHNHIPQAPMTVFCYAFAHRTPDDQWRTIMSNPPGTFVDLFSSPALEFAGWPLGVSGAGCPSDAADCVTTMNNTAELVSNYRPTAAGDIPAASTVGLSLLGAATILAGAWIVMRRRPMARAVKL